MCIKKICSFMANIYFELSKLEHRQDMPVAFRPPGRQTSQVQVRQAIMIRERERERERRM
jgi:hypothetical protein